MHFLSQYSINVIKNKGLKNDIRFGIFLLKEQFVKNGAIKRQPAVFRCPAVFMVIFRGNALFIAHNDQRQGISPE